MTSTEFLELARSAAANEYNGQSMNKISAEDVQLVWYSGALQHHKAVFCTDPTKDPNFYQVIYDGDRKLLYVDTYRKWTKKSYRVKTDKEVPVWLPFVNI